MTWEEYGKTERPNRLFTVVVNAFEPGALGFVLDTFTNFEDARREALQEAVRRTDGDWENENEGFDDLDEIPDELADNIEEQDEGRFLVGSEECPAAIVEVHSTWLCNVGYA